MSLLWTRAMPWYDERLEPHEYEYDVRDVDEPNRQRGQRFKQRVMDHHGVDDATAQRAIEHVVKGQDNGVIWADPSEYGFASARRAFDNYPSHLISKLMDPDTWKGREPQEVDLTEPIHASQDFIRHKSVAHNLFHPGKKQPAYQDDAVGDPDYDPDQDQEEDDGYGEESSEGVDHGQVYFMRRHNGRMEVVDGHHRVATNLLLGKRSMPGMVIHEHEISGGR